MAALVWVSPDLGTVLTPHVSLQFMDWRRLGPANDLQRHRLVGTASEAFDFEVSISGIERVAERGRWLRRSLKAQRVYSKPRKPADRLPCGLPSPALPLPGSIRRKWSRVTWCPGREDRPATMDRQAATDCGG
jgi:hypothetical protein